MLAAAVCLGVLLAFSPELSAQCQMCRTALTQSVEGQRWSRGINAGILLLGAAPFLIAATIMAVIFRGQLHDAWRRFRVRALPSGARRSSRVHLRSLIGR